MEITPRYEEVPVSPVPTQIKKTGVTINLTNSEAALLRKFFGRLNPRAFKNIIEGQDIRPLLEIGEYPSGDTPFLLGSNMYHQLRTNGGV